MKWLTVRYKFFYLKNLSMVVCWEPSTLAFRTVRCNPASWECSTIGVLIQNFKISKFQTSTRDTSVNSISRLSVCVHTCTRFQKKFNVPSQILVFGTFLIFQCNFGGTKLVALFLSSLSRCPNFRGANYRASTVLDTDADANRIGCILMQWHLYDTLQPLVFFSKTLTDTERKYGTTNWARLVIIWALLLLRPYLDGTRFTIRTDHDPLKWLFGSNTKGGKLALWRLRLKEFEFDV